MAGFSPQRTFRTAPATPQAFTVIAYGDQGTSPEASSVAALTDAQNPTCVLVLGDLSYADGASPGLWDDWFALVEPFAARAPLMAAVGNHEVEGGQLPAFLARFALPGNERWYSFRIGDAHIAVIDSTRPTAAGTPQHDWLTADLLAAVQDPAVRWKIAVCHYSPYTSSAVHPHHGDAVRADLVPLFDAYHVDLVLSAHEHHYERSHPLRFGATPGAPSAAYLDPVGTVYVVAGTGGESLYSFQSVIPPRSAVRALFRGILRVDGAPGGPLSVQAIALGGSTQDAFSITKSPVDTIPPEVVFAGPSAGARLTRGAIALRARAADNAGVVNVEFFVDGVPLAADALAPYGAAWPAASASLGRHLLAARATDAMGNQTTTTIEVVLGSSDGEGCGLLGIEPLLLALLARRRPRPYPR
jgi:hypothetical protein